jgi:Fe-S-cluster containining protein
MANIKSGSQFSLRICNECRGPNCCEVEPPFLTAGDVVQISNSTDLGADVFSEERKDGSDKTFRQMKVGADGKCIFYSSQSGKCGIYENRPLDCKLFPMDIDVQDGKFVWILYRTCPVEKGVTNAEAKQMVDLANSQVLPHIRDDLKVYAQLEMQLFSSGQWIKIGDTGLALDSEG